MPESLITRGIAPAEAIAWHEKARALGRECGCEAGAKFMVATLAFYPFAWFWGLKPFLGLWLALALWPVAAFAASGLGKSIGIALAKRDLRRHVRTMELRLKGVTPSCMGGNANA